jgi:S-DNA-T family DNA segregation ATPase FtsK/SpoIIIE
VSPYIGLILFGYSKADPGWSHAAQVERIANPGGRVGAWMADLLLYLFGLSAWWWVLFLLFLVVWGYRRLEGLFHTDRRPFFIALSGFVVLIAASSGLESLRFHSMKKPLPRPGSMLSRNRRLFSQFFGYTSGTLLLMRCLPPACRFHGAVLVEADRAHRSAAGGYLARQQPSLPALAGSPHRPRDRAATRGRGGGRAQAHR